MMAIHVADASTPRNGEHAHEQVFCALTGKPISAQEAYWAPPLVTARELVTTVVRCVITSPGMLSNILLDSQPDVPYDPAIREQLAARRSAEQMKLLVGLLLLIAFIAAPIILLTMR
jgi:hypothetical protein